MAKDSINCAACGESFTPQRSTAKFCSDACRGRKHLANKKRITIPRDLRFSVLRRDNFRCRYCGHSPSAQRELRVDHVVSVKDGGALTDPDNLVTTCHDCNSGKGEMSLDLKELPPIAEV